MLVEVEVEALHIDFVSLDLQRKGKIINRGYACSSTGYTLQQTKNSVFFAFTAKKILCKEMVAKKAKKTFYLKNTIFGTISLLKKQVCKYSVSHELCSPIF